MQDFVEGNKHLQTQIDIFSQLELINVTEIEILQEVLLAIDTKYFEDKQNLDPALVCALLLNHPHISSFYATSPRGYRKQQAKYRQQCQPNVANGLLSWAIEQVRQLNTPRTLEQDLVIANSSVLKKVQAKSWRAIEKRERPRIGQTDIFDVLANLSLTNLMEQEVVKDAHSHIQTDYTSKSDRINLSDVCALVLNHENVPPLYATNAKEYNQHKQTYLAQYQTKVRKIIRKTVYQVNLEGSEHSFNLSAMAKTNANLRNVNSWNNSAIDSDE